MRGWDRQLPARWQALNKTAEDKHPTLKTYNEKIQLGNMYVYILIFSNVTYNPNNYPHTPTLDTANQHNPIYTYMSVITCISLYFILKYLQIEWNVSSESMSKFQKTSSFGFPEVPGSPPCYSLASAAFLLCLAFKINVLLTSKLGLLKKVLIWNGMNTIIST